MATYTNFNEIKRGGGRSKPCSGTLHKAGCRV